MNNSALQGCTDGGCIIRKPEGMHTNGGCGCERELRQALGFAPSQRFIRALRERQREVAELREALERFAKEWRFLIQIGQLDDHGELAQAEAALKHSAQGTFRE